MTTPAMLDNREKSDTKVDINKPPYIYDRNGYWWYVWKLEYTGRCSHGTKVSEPMTKEEAMKEAYRLNGWNYVEPNEIRTKKPTENRISISRNK